MIDTAKLRQNCASLLLAFLATICLADAALAAEPHDDSYYVSPDGSDSNPGTITQPWRTIRKAAREAQAGDTIYLRGGEYRAVFGGNVFQNSGSAEAPITVTNYPEEQVILRHTGSENDVFFRCWAASDWRTPKADYIRILGSQVSPRVLSNGVESSKGIVAIAPDGVPTPSASIVGKNCEYWEVAGVDFVYTGAAIRTYKSEGTAGHWYVHDNRVYGFYTEAGIQLNGDYNRVEDNEIQRQVNELYNPHGCQDMNFLGHDNVIRGNYLGRGTAATVECRGLLFEWDGADGNLVEENRIQNMTDGIVFAGGDNNVVRNNVVSADNPGGLFQHGVVLYSYPDGTTTWPCQDSPTNCRSDGNLIEGNLIRNYEAAVWLYRVSPGSLTVRNNLFSGVTRSTICSYDVSSKGCKPPPSQVVAEYNTECTDCTESSTVSPNSGNSTLSSPSSGNSSSGSPNSGSPDPVAFLPRGQAWASLGAVMALALVTGLAIKGQVMVRLLWRSRTTREPPRDRGSLSHLSSPDLVNDRPVSEDSPSAN